MSGSDKSITSTPLMLMFVYIFTSQGHWRYKVKQIYINRGWNWNFRRNEQNNLAKLIRSKPQHNEERKKQHRLVDRISSQWKRSKTRITWRERTVEHLSCIGQIMRFPMTTLHMSNLNAIWYDTLMMIISRRVMANLAHFCWKVGGFAGMTRQSCPHPTSHQ